MNYLEQVEEEWLLNIERRIKIGRKTRKEIEESKLASAKRKASVMCKCTNRVPYGVFNKKGWAVCNVCGRKVLKPQDEFKSVLLNMLGKVK